MYCMGSCSFPSPCQGRIWTDLLEGVEVLQRGYVATGVWGNNCPSENV